MGLRDLYRHGPLTGNNVVDTKPVDLWDLMGAETNPPQSFSSYTKENLGWITEITTITETGYYSLYPLTNIPTEFIEGSLTIKK
jgi:hypothetical protein